jgi:hypothetical protein
MASRRLVDMYMLVQTDTCAFTSEIREVAAAGPIQRLEGKPHIQGEVTSEFEMQSKISLSRRTVQGNHAFSQAMYFPKGMIFQSNLGANSKHAVLAGTDESCAQSRIQPRHVGISEVSGQDEPVIDLRGKFSQQGPSLGSLLLFPTSPAEAPMTLQNVHANAGAKQSSGSTLNVFDALGSVQSPVNSVAVQGVIVPDIVSACLVDHGCWRVAVGSSTLAEVIIYETGSVQKFDFQLLQKVRAPHGLTVKGVCTRAGVKSGSFIVALGKRMGDAQFATLGPAKWQLFWSEACVRTGAQNTAADDAGSSTHVKETLGIIVKMMVKMDAKLEGIEGILREHSSRLTELTRDMKILQAASD